MRLKKSVDGRTKGTLGERGKRYLRKIQGDFYMEGLEKIFDRRRNIQTGIIALKLERMLRKEGEDFMSYLKSAIPFISMEYIERCMKMATAWESGNYQGPRERGWFEKLFQISKNRLISDFLIKHGVDVDFCWTDESAVKNFQAQIDTLFEAHRPGKRKDCKICYPKRKVKKREA